MCIFQMTSERWLIFLIYFFIGYLYFFFSIFFCQCFSYGFIKIPSVLMIKYQPYILHCHNHFCSLTYVSNMLTLKFQLRIHILYSFCMCTVVPSFLWFHFSWFQLLRLTKVQKQMILLTQNQKVNSSLMLSQNAYTIPSPHVITQASYQLISSPEEG